MIKEKFLLLVVFLLKIDIPGRISVKRKYVDAVLQAGGIPFILPFTDNVQILQSVVSFIDGLLLTGGGDISPVIYGESTLPECENVAGIGMTLIMLCCA